MQTDLDNAKTFEDKLAVIREDRITQYSNKWVEISPAVADEEIFAKFFGDTTFVTSEDLDTSLENLLDAAETYKERNAISEFFHQLKQWVLYKLGKTDVYYKLSDIEKEWLKLVKEAQTNYESKEQKTTADNGGVKYSYSFADNRNLKETREINNIINKNIDIIGNKEIFNEKSVDISNYKKKSDYVLEIFSKQGNIAKNKIIGDVELVKSGAKSTMLHGFGKNKIAAIPAIKSVIENGQIIDKSENYEQRGYDRYILASRGKIDGNNAVIAVVVKSYQNKYNNKFYLHEVEIIEADVSSMTAPQLSVDTVNTSASTDIISSNDTKSQEKYSFPSNTEEYDKLNSELQGLYNEDVDLNIKAQDFKKTAEYNKFIEALSNKELSSDDVQKIIDEYAKWEKDSGFAEVSKKLSENTGREKELRARISDIEKANHDSFMESIQEFSDEDVKKYVSKAVRRYGTTSKYSNASYLLTNGSLLDFSDRQGYRVKDHREISEILDLPDYAEYSDGMIAFMNMGNIRLQSYGIDISAMPNAKQISVLRDFINKLDGEFTVDFSKKNGNTDASVEYPEGTSSSKIISDIKNYFEDGIIPEINNSLNEFRYSIPDTDSDGNKLSAGQQEYFKDSKVRDENGNLRVVYHGTNAEFYTFRQSGQRGDNGAFGGIGFYFTDDKNMASRYGKNVLNVYLDIKKPLSQTQLTLSQNELNKFFDALAKEQKEHKYYKGEWYGNSISSMTDYLKSEYKDYNSDQEWLDSLLNWFSAGDPDVMQGVLYTLKNTLGYDGYINNGISIAFTPEQIKLTTNLNPTENEDIRYSLPDNVDKYTEKQYNNFGWVVVNDVLTGKELKKLYSKFADAKLLKNKYPKSANGEYMIAVGDKYSVDDKIVYLKGTNQNPIITKVLKIVDVDDSDKNFYINEVVHYEQLGIRDSYEILEAYAGKEIFNKITLRDCISYSEAKSGGQKDSKVNINDRVGRTGARNPQRSTINVEAESNDPAFSMPENKYSIVDEQWDKSIEDYGAIDETAEVKVPKSVDGDKVVSRVINNVLNHTELLYLCNVFYRGFIDIDFFAVFVK